MQGAGSGAGEGNDRSVGEQVAARSWSDEGALGCRVAVRRANIKADGLLARTQTQAHAQPEPSQIDLSIAGRMSNWKKEGLLHRRMTKSLSWRQQSRHDWTSDGILSAH